MVILDLIRKAVRDSVHQLSLHINAVQHLLISTFSFFTFEYLQDSIHLLKSQINYSTLVERYGIT